MTRRTAATFALLSLASASVAPAAQRPSSDAFAEASEGLARAFREGAAERGIVGAGLLVLHRGAVLSEVYHGHQDVEGKDPVDAETAFHWASITKTFTAVATMRLRDLGRLSLDDPAVRHIPELREVHAPFGGVERITLRHLASHSAGFRGPTWPWGGDQPWHPFEPTRWDQVVAMFPYTELMFKPGTKYSYSNPGVIFLGRIIERFSGDDYEVYIAKNLFMPLGMTHAFFDRAPYHLVAHRSHSYVRTDEGLKEQRFDFDSGITVSNGGLNAPLGDMAKWLAFLIGAAPDPATRSAWNGVLERSSLAEMFTPQIRAEDGEGGSGNDVQAGLSCFFERQGGTELVGHSGDQIGFISHLYLHVPSKAGYIVSFNTD